MASALWIYYHLRELKISSRHISHRLSNPEDTAYNAAQGLQRRTRRIFAKIVWITADPHPTPNQLILYENTMRWRGIQNSQRLMDSVLTSPWIIYLPPIKHHCLHAIIKNCLVWARVFLRHYMTTWHHPTNTPLSGLLCLLNSTDFKLFRLLLGDVYYTTEL